MTDRDAITATDDLLMRFAARAGVLGVRVERVVTSADAVPVVERIVAEIAARDGYLSDELRQAAPTLTRALDDVSIDWRTPADARQVRDALLGLSVARIAIAETGSVLLAEQTLPDRAIGMLVANQIVVCPTAALVPTMDEAVSALREVATRPGAGMATLVTGPSRTADIERVLTVGVQGPRQVAVLFVDRLD